MNADVTVANESTFLSPEGIEKIEQKYKAKYVLETSIKGTYGWLDFPAAIFYTETAHPNGSNYFAIHCRTDGTFPGKNWTITDGLSAVDGVVFTGLEHDGKVYYSRYCHDYRSVGNSEYFVDGGREYTRYGGPDLKKVKLVNFVVVKDRLVIQE